MTDGTVKKNTLVDVHLLNRGAQCTDVNVYAGDTIVTRAAFLPTGKEAKFRLELSSEMPEGVYPIRVEYVDAMGLPREKILTPELQKDVAGHAFLKL